ncbi:MAG: MFS transporter [Hyphomicrobiales bacterium]
MTYLAFLQANLRWVAGGFLLTFASSFGQTYYISLFAGQIRSEFALSHGDFGALYAIATVGSAFTLIWLGKLADTMRAVYLGIGALFGLAAACIGMGLVSSAIMLVFVLYGLRLFGQGMLSHIAFTLMGKWFNAQRGRAVSLVSLGFAGGEALAPFAVVALAAAIGWRQTWFLAAAILVLGFAPLVWRSFYVQRVPKGKVQKSENVPDEPSPVRDWTRKEVLRDFVFYATLPGLLTPTFMITGILFHQVHLVETKGWELAVFTTSYPIFAGCAVVIGLWAGSIVDRWSACAFLPVFLLPLAAGALLLAYVDALWAAYGFMLLMGVTVGISPVMHGGLWAELYGTRHLGAIRALDTSLMVFTSALAPVTMGWLIDIGVELETQFIWMAGYIFVVSVMLFVLFKTNRVSTAHALSSSTLEAAR